MAEYLGSEERNVQRWYVFIIFLLAYFIIFYGVIGATGKAESTLYFYIGFTAILGLIPIALDLITKRQIPLDTVVHEGKTGLRSFKSQIVIGVIICILYGFFIFQTGTALIKAPQFGVFEGKTGEGLLSGLVGSMETLPFFCVLFPTAYALLYKRFGILALLFSTIITVVSFTVYHFWAYQYNPVALQSVALFAVINVALIYVFRSALIPFMIHFVNNFLVVILILQAYGFFVI